MPLLNTATKVYKGTSLATKVYQGTNLVWPPAPSGPAGIAGLVGYWDARDLTDGAVTTWAAHAGASAGSVTGTGTKTSDYVTNPALHGNASATTLGVTVTSAKTIFFIGSVSNMGSDTVANFLINLSEPASSTSGPGIAWYNYFDTVNRIMHGGGIATAAAGIAQKSINIRYLWIVTYTAGSTFGTMYTYLENGTGNSLTAPTGTGTSVLHVGTNYNNQSNILLNGRVCAFGMYSNVISAADITILRGWANTNFGVVN
jgi:hypothetical protein